MGYLDWSDAYALGIPEIDAQHRGLLRMIQAFYDTLETHSLAEASDALLVRMHAYAEEHFATEEDFLRRHGYPELEQHARQHQAYVHRLAKLAQQREDHTLGGSLALTNFLKDWWREHILKSDMAYRDWLREHPSR